MSQEPTEQAWEQNPWTAHILRWQDDWQAWKTDNALQFKAVLGKLEFLDEWRQHLEVSLRSLQQEQMVTRAMVAEWNRELHEQRLTDERRLQDVRQLLVAEIAAQGLEIDALQADVAGLKVKVGYWGALGALLGAVAAGLAWLLARIVK